MKLTVVRTDEPDKWDRLVGRAQHDFYQLASYHRLAEERGEGEARLVVLEDDSCSFALPILLRRVAEVPGLESSPLTDVTSVYGYAGPLVEPERPRAESRARVEGELRSSFEQLGVCSVFARLHPLLAQTGVLDGLGEIRDVGPTVSIDLAAPLDEQWAAVRHGHKSDIKRLRCAGFHCLHDVHLQHLDDFVKLYDNTMRRVGADGYYMFDRGYFGKLFSLEGVEVHLFVCLFEGVTTCGGVFTRCGGIVEYHLSGTLEEYSRSAPTKLMLDEVRKWAADQGARVFHLGGGVGSRQDALFDFKSGFSKGRNEFRVWAWIRDAAAYGELVLRRKAYLSSRGQRPASDRYFPAYRAPAEGRGSEPQA